MKDSMLLHTETMHWDPAVKRLTVDASDCGLKPGAIPTKKISVVSGKTGNIKQFEFFKNVIYDDEVYGWIYECTDPNIVCSLHIVND